MPARQITREEWAAFFDTFSRHYRGRFVDVQILADNLGLYRLVEGQPLVGITAQLNDAPGEIEVIAGEGMVHVTHVIREPSQVWVEQGKNGHDSSLKIVSGDGTAILIQFAVAEPRAALAAGADFPIIQSERVPKPLIIVAVDNSDPALWAATAAGNLARRLGAEVLLVHVVNPAEIFASEEYVPQDVYTAIEEAGKGALEAARKLIPTTVHATTTIEEGEPSRRIAQLSDERNADYIVIGSHGRGRVTQLLMGSTASAVARRARCPVLVVSHMPSATQPDDQSSCFVERLVEKLNPAEVPLE
jgi:nucleotide-binding universal stress UspA family protein